MKSGWRIGAGTNVLPQFSMVHSDPIEFERPDCFCPERHIDGDGRFVKVLEILNFKKNNSFFRFRILASLRSP